MNKIESINDFVVRFANVNGSGSASANNLFAQAIFRLGIPVSPKNIFPSNIQGLPTWYEVRVNEHGYLGRRGGVDMSIAVNGQTLYNDYLEVLPGGYFIYDSTKELSEEFSRNDLTTIGIPLTRLCNDEFQNPKLRQLLRNIIYVGSLAYLLDMDFSVLTDSIKKQFQKKPKLAEPNIKALELGYDYAKEHHQGACKLSVRKSNKLVDEILMDGNSAIGLGAVYAGATVTGWYPITPSTSVIEAFERYAGKFRTEPDTGRHKVAIIQAEDELAALGIVIGASWNGARAFTATSGPGISLMSEFLGLAYFAEIPVVLVDVQRTGPSTGMPTRTQQSDLLSCAYASHGDTKNVLLFPCDPKECFDMGADAFDLAERLQTPIIIMSDLDLGMNDHVSAPLHWDDNRKYDRGKVLSAEDLDNLKERWGRYLDVDGDGICYRTYPGTHPTKGAYFTRGTSHNEYSAYTEYSPIYRAGMERLLVKWETARTMVPKPHIKIRDPKATVGVIFFGTTTHAAYEAISRSSKKGLKINSLRVRAFPFHDEVVDFIDRHETIFVIEQNRDAQLRTMLMAENGVSPQKMQSILYFEGMPVTADFITENILALLDKDQQAAAKSSKGEKA
ncbi:2-oxoacid:acceptor oxidoreductase subunit alpha [Desulfopila sp. IMCC35006]|uniref:2-oxoacid:acceptor oxidoreductase subunit alpha n=1 Tax=Desulfopila sp. IMCC35006 TaxID=2569542 RepID=UPI0010ACEDD3|nr:2-oxoacid:acceptor oxidoreductase subunit alpha [Desulfopila sp. IMCC35006]TKB24448.1 2-oxoacid:acceptor oxidoreductase subunit alpha [Desulfopila sp. IMCC35006]